MYLPTIKEEVLDYRYSRILEPWSFYSEILGCLLTIPRGFVYDHESVPILKGTSHRGGLGHDYLSRKDSVPCVKKGIAAKVYREIMTAQNKPIWRRRLKYAFVLVWPGYFHKHSVFATYEEITGRKENVDKSGS